MKWMVWILAFCALASASTAVNLDTNITLRSVCVNQYGNLCTDTASWTIYDPNQTILYNNTVGSTTGVLSKFTFWANMTGVYFGYVNYSAQNVTASWNIAVEDYKTAEIKSIWDNVKMIMLSLTLLAIVFGMVYAAFKLEQEHLFLKVLLFFGSIIFMIGSLGIARYGLTNSDQLRISDSLFWVLIIIFVIMFFYLGIYIFVQRAKFAAATVKEQNEKDKIW
jgi:hypothetical protein